MWVTNPATGERLAEVADTGPSAATRACDAAGRAQRDWARRAPRERSEILLGCHAAMVGHASELAALITAENGKPLSDALGEVMYAAEFFRWCAEEAVRLGGDYSTSPSGSNKILVSHPPVGVVAVITPWNFPAAMITRKVAPALAAGNATIVKPSEETPLTALRIAELMGDAGVPDGLVRVLPTEFPDDWFNAVIVHEDVRMLSFTGSTGVGQTLLRRCADRVLKVTMELGGNAPFVVFNDADVDAAVAGAMTAKMRHSAQTCTAADRFYVEAEIADDFVERLAERMGATTVGDGRETGVECGPLINRRAVTRVDDLVTGAIRSGATAVCGGASSNGPGSYYSPTVLVDVPSDSEVVRSEIFGPVIPVMTFTDRASMLTAVNDSPAGLAGYVYSRDLGKAMSTAERIEAGMVAVNRGLLSDPAAPFGGMKQSGLGREGGPGGVLEFCETQYIAVQW